MTPNRPPRLLLLTALMASAFAASAQMRAYSAPAAQVARDAQPVAATPAAGPQTSVLRPCASVSVDPPTQLALGKSRVIRLDFPALRMIIPHGGGAVPYHWGRYRGLAQDMKRPPLIDLIRDNVFFDTCVYHQPGIDLLMKVVPADNILFGSEMVGAVRGIDPETGHYFDDTKRYVDGSALGEAEKSKIFEGNVRKVYPRINKALAVGSKQ